MLFQLKFRFFPERGKKHLLMTSPTKLEPACLCLVGLIEPADP